jgi:alkylation response protein AidB-like acyl-CoA dehydrogenase
MARVVRLTAEYTCSREQFGRPIGSFQAVGQRAADAFTSAWAIELTARQACWHLASGSVGPDRDAAVAVASAVATAKYTAATAGAEVVRAAHHLHGGIGLDRDYPLHRYTMLAKRLELLLGGASEQAVLLGDVLAAAAIRAAEHDDTAVAAGGV